MLWRNKKTTVMGCIAILLFAGSATLNARALVSDISWQHWFASQLAQHPDVVAATHARDASISTAQGRDKPLYNPELDTEFEREGSDTNYRLGISQTIDLWDKRSTRQQQSEASRIAAQQAYQRVVQQTYAGALRAIITWQAARQRAELAREQQAQLTTMVALLKERQRLGDLGLLDVELAYLSLSQKLNSSAQAIASFKQAEAQLRELLPGWTEDKASIPAEVWAVIANPEQQAAEQLDEHPRVWAARAQWRVLQREAELAGLATRADPTLGINAGRSADEPVMALTLSIPLNVRNNYSADARAATQLALAAEADYLSVRRNQQFAIEAINGSLVEYQQQYQRWQSLMAGRAESSQRLLSRLWRSSELGTSEYLLALQQRAEGLLAGIELQQQLFLTRIDWLQRSGKLSAAMVPAEPGSGVTVSGEIQPPTP